MGTSIIPGFTPGKDSIPQLIRASTRHFGDHQAIRDGDTIVTYDELGKLVDRAARAMLSSGIEAGDTVAVWAPNSWQWVVAGLAVSRAGAVLVPINTRFKGNEAAYVLNAASVKMLFVSDGFLDTSYSGSLANESVPSLTATIDLTNGGAAGTSNFDDFLTLGDGPSSAEQQHEIDSRLTTSAPSCSRRAPRVIQRAFRFVVVRSFRHSIHTDRHWACNPVIPICS